MRRLIVLTATITAVDAMLFTALAPLVPGYARSFGLDKTGAGLLVGAFGVGAFVGGLLATLVAVRVGPKPTVLAGLCLLSVASLAFAFAGGAWALGVSRAVQGLASTTTWSGALAWIAVTAPERSRGQAIGTVFGIAVAGAVTGPLFGGLAHAIGIRVSFAAVGVLALVLAAGAALSAVGPHEEVVPGALGRALRDPRYLGALWLNTLPAGLFGLTSVLMPLAFARHGFSPLEIAIVFVGAGLLEVVLNPVLGRLVDRRGTLQLIRVGLVASATVSLGLASVGSAAGLVAIYPLAAVAFGSFYTPGMVLGSARATRAGLSQGIAFATMNSAWALGELAGPTIGGRLADLSGDATSFLSLAAVCATTLVATEWVARGRLVERAT